MPTLMMLRFDGDPADLLARKERYLDPVTARVGPQSGGLVHLTAQTPDGLLVINVMADGDPAERAGSHPEVAQALRESGLPEPGRERYEIARFVLSPAAAEATTE